MTDKKESISKQGSQQEKSPNGSQSNGKIQTPPPTPISTVLALVFILVVTYVTLPTPFQPEGKPTVHHVWYYGWITAVSTGLGVLPLIIMPNLESYWVGISNGKRRGLFLSFLLRTCS